MSTELVEKLVIKQFADGNRKITPSAASLLAKYCQNSFSRIDSEINKIFALFPPGDTVDTKHIDQIVASTPEHQIFELANALGKRDIELAQKIESRLLASGFDHYAIFGNLVSTSRRLFYSLATTCPNDSVATLLKCSPYAINYARRDNKHLASRIHRLYSFALDLEHKIKSGMMTPHAATTLLQMAFVV